MAQYVLPDLPYSYEALEPHISAEILQIHHQKHHQSYVDHLNNALEKYNQAQAKNDLSTMISLQPIIRFNGGGHLNHTFFWASLTAQDQDRAFLGELAHRIKEQWGSKTAFIKTFNAFALTLQGSGWCWLGFCLRTGQLHIHTTSNQDPIGSIYKEAIPILKVSPLLGIDMWEHAYYLQYRQDQMAYLNAIWEVVNWTMVSKRYHAVLQTYQR